MAKDARIAVTFRTHPKRIKLQRRLGADGVLAFIDLILFTTEVRPDGAFVGMGAEDISIAAQWSGDAEKFVAALVDVGLLDRSEKHDGYAMHDWSEHNPYAAYGDRRSMQAKANAHVGWLKRKATVCNIRGCQLCKLHADGIRTSNTHHAVITIPQCSSSTSSSTSNKESKASCPKRSARTFSDDSLEMKEARYLFGKIRTNNATAKEPNWQRWARDFDLILRVDECPPAEVRALIDFAQTDPFWLTNVLSPAALRKHYDRLTLRAREIKPPAFDRSRPVV